MIVAVPKETFPGEKRVATTPGAVPALMKLGLSVRVESGAGLAAGFTDEQYRQRGAEIVEDRASLYAEAGLIAQVRTPGANPDEGAGEIGQLRPGQVLVGHAEPLTASEPIGAICEAGATLLAMELIPRITRAQSMDALSSQANLAGYKAVLLAADRMAKALPMFMTAAGTIKPAKVFVIGAGVAGLQAIATAKRLGAVVSATDVRPATKEQVESLGAKFVMVEEAMAEGEGGYAKELTPEQREKQKQLVADVVAESDIVITTAAIPGRKAPTLIDEAMVERMQPGAVVMDLAAERGGNCELTEPDRVVEKHNVTIIGTTNLPSTVSHDASAMYANNVVKLLGEFVKDGEASFDMDNEVVAGCLVCRGGEVHHPRVREAMGLAPIEKPAASSGADGVGGEGGEDGEDGSSDEGSGAS